MYMVASAARVRASLALILFAFLGIRSVSCSLSWLGDCRVCLARVVQDVFDTFGVFGDYGEEYACRGVGAD